MTSLKPLLHNICNLKKKKKCCLLLIVQDLCGPLFVLQKTIFMNTMTLPLAGEHEGNFPLSSLHFCVLFGCCREVCVCLLQAE